MSLPEIFTQTPLEAGIWTAAVGAQTAIAKAITSSAVFYGAVTLSLAIGAIMFLFGIGSGGSTKRSISRFLLLLVTIAIGFSFLKKENSTPFSPVNATGVKWRSVSKVASNPKYKSLQSNYNGLFWYTTFHKSMSEIAHLMTDIIAKGMDDPNYNQAPEFLLNALAQTARATIDDPEVERKFDVLVHNCTDTKRGKVLGNNDSIKTLFDLSSPDCNATYSELVTSLRTWAERNRPAILTTPPIGSSIAIAFDAFALSDVQVVDNKMIASAVKNYARQKIGETSDFHNTNADASINGTDFWVNLNKYLFSTDSIMIGINGVKKLFGFETSDLEGANARNEAAVKYNKLLQFLPAVRGYASAILAYSWIVAAVALCVGVHQMFLSWLKMTAWFCLYMPFSAALYQFTTKMIATTENIQAMNSLRVDPMILAGANVIDYNIARMQLVYFILQLSLMAFFGFAGIRSFAPIATLRHSYIGDIVRNGGLLISTVARIPLPAKAAAISQLTPPPTQQTDNKVT